MSTLFWVLLIVWLITMYIYSKKFKKFADGVFKSFTNKAEEISEKDNRKN